MGTRLRITTLFPGRAVPPEGVPPLRRALTFIWRHAVQPETVNALRAPGVGVPVPLVPRAGRLSTPRVFPGTRVKRSAPASRTKTRPAQLPGTRCWGKPAPRLFPGTRDW
ncbi:MAG: hypothetical protein MdMp014T_2280 [Treponematales bacterium]